MHFNHYDLFSTPKNDVPCCTMTTTRTEPKLKWVVVRIDFVSAPKKRVLFERISVNRRLLSVYPSRTADGAKPVFDFYPIRPDKRIVRKRPHTVRGGRRIENNLTGVGLFPAAKGIDDRSAGTRAHTPPWIMSTRRLPTRMLICKHDPGLYVRRTVSRAKAVCKSRRLSIVALVRPVSTTVTLCVRLFIWVRVRRTTVLARGLFSLDF